MQAKNCPCSFSKILQEMLEMHYPLIHHSNQRPYHFIHGYAQFLEEQLGVRVPVTRFHGDVYLSDEEKRSPLPVEWEVPERYWLIVAGGDPHAGDRRLDAASSRALPRC